MITCNDVRYTEGRHMGVVPNNYNTCFCRSVPERSDIQPRTDITRQDVKILRWAPRSVCLPSV